MIAGLPAGAARCSLYLFSFLLYPLSIMVAALQRAEEADEVFPFRKHPAAVHLQDGPHAHGLHHQRQESAAT